MTETELLEMVRQEVAARQNQNQDPEARKRTAKRCRECFAENEAVAECCVSCGRDLAVRCQPGKALTCPESGETNGESWFVVKVGHERRALLGEGGRLVVGRGEAADIWIESSTVSRNHVEIAWD